MDLLGPLLPVFLGKRGEGLNSLICLKAMSLYAAKALLILPILYRTLQELCNAREVEVVTQPITEEATEAGLLAVANDEDSMFPEAREWHQGRASHCRPYWLSGLNMDGIDVSIGRYNSICKQVFCKYPADKVRALYPLIFNSPCEDESEIMSLVVDVAYAVTQASDQSADDCKAQIINSPALHSAGLDDAAIELPQEVKAGMPAEAIQFLLLVKSNKSSHGGASHNNIDVWHATKDTPVVSFTS